MKTYLKIQEVEKIIYCATSIRDRLLIRLLFQLGCRVSEALNITLDDIDFEQETIKILHLKTRSILLCPSCKTRLARNHRFCPKCGNSISNTINRENINRRQRIKIPFSFSRNIFAKTRISISTIHSLFSVFHGIEPGR